MIKTFRVGELFDIHPTATYKMKNDELFASDGTTPVLSNSSVNNGIGGYCGLAPTERGNMITFSDTTTGADTMFYQSGPFIGYPHVQGMYPYQQDKWNEKCCLYAISCIRKSAGNDWNYAVKFNRALVKDLLIELPVVESPDVAHEYTVDDIDYDYMQDRIAELEQDRIAELDAYLKATGLDDYKLTDEDKKTLSLKRASDKANALEADSPDGHVRFKTFRAYELFDIKKGKRLTKANMINGNINFIGSTATNNGLTAKIGNKEHLHPAHTITVSYNGSVGEVFLQDEPFWASDDVNVWYPKFVFNSEAICYIMSVIKKCRTKYNYAAKWTIDRMRNEMLVLPVNPDGDIDFDYMEHYIRAIEKLTIAGVVKFRDREIAAARQAVNA